VCVYTGSLDETVGIWELDGTKGVECSQQRFLDIPSNVHPGLTYRRGLASTFAPNRGAGALVVGGDKLMGTPAHTSAGSKIASKSDLLTKMGSNTQVDKVFCCDESLPCHIVEILLWRDFTKS
jgi:hypothetical protein